MDTPGAGLGPSRLPEGADLSDRVAHALDRVQAPIEQLLQGRGHQRGVVNVDGVAEPRTGSCNAADLQQMPVTRMRRSLT